MQYNVGLGQNYNINLDKQKFPAIYKCNHTSETTSESKLEYIPDMMGCSMLLESKYERSKLV